MNDKVLPVLEEWTNFIAYLLDITAQFPRRMRFTFVNRIDNLALDIAEKLLEARYQKKDKRTAILDRINLELDKMRILLRICHQKKLLATRAFECCARSIESCGRQVGGWRKESKS